LSVRYLYFFERALRDRVERAMLSWWDCRTGPQRPARVPQALRARTLDGQGNPLHSARVPRLALEQGRRAGLQVAARTRREPGDPALLPRAEEVRAVLELRDFLDFSFALEGLHDRVHVWVGGTRSELRVRRGGSTPAERGTPSRRDRSTGPRFAPRGVGSTV
jgi:tyrosinase